MRVQTQRTSASGGVAGFRGATLAAVLTWALAACGHYEPPRPGVHQAPGEAVSEVVCVTETPTATRFTRTQCMNRADMAARGEADRQATDSIKTPPPEVK